MIQIPRYFAGLALLLFIVAAAGCKSQDEPAPSPKPVDQGDYRSVLTPKKTVQSFCDLLRGEMVNAGLFLLDEIDYGSQAAEFVRVKIKTLSSDMARGEVDIVPLDQELDQDCAAVIVRETRGGSSDLAVMYLVFRNNRWNLSPELWNYERMLNISSAQKERFGNLKRWYLIRRGELRAEGADQR